MNEGDESLENNINHSVDFDYPQDPPTDAETEWIKIKAREMAKAELAMFINKLVSYVLPSKHPRMTLAAFCYVSGMDLFYLLGCDNTQTAIAKTLGVSSKTFDLEVKTIKGQFNL